MARAVATMFFISEIGAPFIANLISDTRCYQELWSPHSHLSMYYESTYCVIFAYSGDVVDFHDYDIRDRDVQVDSLGVFSCVEEYTKQRSLHYPSPWTYSDQCRNAYLTNFLPVIIFSSAFKTFYYPLIYIFLTDKMKDMKENVTVGGWLNCGKLEEYVLTGSYLTLMLNEIWSSFLLMIAYGIVSPVAIIAIGASTIVQIKFLRANIARYFHCQFYETEETGFHKMVARVSRYCTCTVKCFSNACANTNTDCCCFENANNPMGFSFLRQLLYLNA